MIKKICVISSYYPSETDPFFAFVGTLIDSIADTGVECHVISPVSNMEKKHRAVTRVEETNTGAKIQVYCPTYLMFPSRNLLGFETYKLTVLSKRNAVKKAFDQHVMSCDAIYAHFLDSGGIAAWLSKQTGIPAFVAVGESSIEYRKLDYTLFKELLHNNIRGVIAVSSELKRECREKGIFAKKTPIEVFPNAINTNVFKPLDRKECRRKLGIDNSDFVISFVGGFIKRKGFDKLQEVICRHPEWKCILIGAGEISITLPKHQISFSGRVPHDLIPNYICASDVFVLPTTAEGCCNAIIEAMGCGLPIVSSDRAFNYDILNEENSILVDPESVDEIDNAIIELESKGSFRKQLSDNNIIKGEKHSIENRANMILGFMEQHLQ